MLDKIYQEGVAKGKETADNLIREAEQKAELIVKEAQKEAEAIRSQSQKEAEELNQNVTSELHLAARQSISALKQQISKLITLKAIAEPVGKTFSDQDFIKNTIDKLIQNWQQEGNRPKKLSLLLPPDEERQLYRYFSNKSKELLDNSLVIDFDGKLNNGFRIGPADDNYMISFTDKDFETFFLDYLRPRTKELLFNGE